MTSGSSICRPLESPRIMIHEILKCKREPYAESLLPVNWLGDSQ